MSYLDKDAMYYFRDEMEKQAIFMATLKGVGSILKASAKGAKAGAEGFGRLMSRASTMGHKDPGILRRTLGGTLVGVGTLHAANKGVKAFKGTRAAQSNLPQAIRSGDVNLNMY